MSKPRTVLIVARRVRENWRDLVVTDIVFKVVALVVLTPLLGLAQKLLIWQASDGILSDVDFLYLFIQPVGIVCSVLVASIWLAIIGLEQASLLAMLASKDVGKQLRPMAAIRFSLARAPRVLAITATIIATSLAVLAPFALVALLVYRSLLGEFDINFYLSQQPEEFFVAVAIGIVLMMLAVSILLWVHSAWLFALPIALFEDQHWLNSLRLSHQTLEGRRWRVIGWIGVWLLSIFVANFLLVTLGGWAGQLLIPADVGSLVNLATRVGLLLLVLAALGLMINLLATISLGSMMYTGYRLLRPSSDLPAPTLLADDDGVGKRFRLTHLRLAALLGIGLLLAAWLGIRSLTSLPLTNRAKIMAHRGASADAPENTLAAFQLAIDQGADWIELDVQESADGEVIVMHDSDFMKQAHNPLKVWDAERAPLDALDIGSWFDEQFSTERVPRLAEVLEMCRDKVGVNIELKYYGHDQQLEQSVVEVVEAANMSDQVMVMSLKKQGVQKAKSLRPDWKCGLLLSVYAGDLNSLDVDFLAINGKFASRSFVRQAHEAGKEVYVWTINDAATMSQMLNRGVDGLLTDRPELAKRVLAERADMSLPERLLSEISVWLLGTPPVSESSDLQ